MTRSPIAAELKPDQIVAVVDQREKIPLDLAPLRHRFGHLETADYSIEGLEHLIAFERKSLPDLLACCGTSRERFERELARLRGFQVKGLIVEATWADLELGEWRNRISPQAVTGSLLAWSTDGLPVWFAKDHHTAGRIVSRLLFIAARRFYRETRRFVTAAIQHKEAC